MKKSAFKIILVLSITIASGSSCSTSEVLNSQGTPLPNGNNVSFTDEELLDIVQQDAFNYFWDYAESYSKLARERYLTDDTAADDHLIATGGSGFGLMTILVGVKKGFISRNDAVNRLNTALTFLQNADRFHGAWSHWIDGNNGDAVPFSQYDNGGDIVETALLCQGLIAVREYFKTGTTAEQALANKANLLWNGVEWDWYTKGENVMYWHWSPNFGWQINQKLEGHNESLIVYILGYSSPTHPISTATYNQGWARNGSIVTANQKYDIPLIFNHDGATGNVGPMFFAHYSFMGLNPKGLTDQYANYWDLNANHTRIMLQHCVQNPNNWNGYSDKFWGLTSSYTRNTDGTIGYTAHQPNNDRGIIAPTAAISSFPYAPEDAMRFLRFLYQEKRNEFVGVAGPYDAISIHYGNWVAPRYLAIDQGTISTMIENHRSSFLWDLFMNAPDVKTGLMGLGFHSTTYGF